MMPGPDNPGRTVREGDPDAYPWSQAKVTQDATKMLRDCIGRDEQIHNDTVEVCEALESHGWRVHERKPRGLRYWCPCTRQHQTWVEVSAQPTDPHTFLSVLARRTCYTTGGETVGNPDGS